MEIELKGDVWMLRRWLTLGTALMIALALAACGGNDDASTGSTDQPPASEEGQAPAASPVADDEVVAHVNGEALLGSAYNSVYDFVLMDMIQYGQNINDEQVQSMIKEQALEIVIGNKLLVQDAANKGYEVQDNEVQEELKNIKSQFENEQAFQTALEQSNLTMEELELQIREDLMIEKYIENEIEKSEVSNEEVQNYYDQFFGGGEDSPSFEEVEELIREMIQFQDMEAKLIELVNVLKENSDIEILI